MKGVTTSRRTRARLASDGALLLVAVAFALPLVWLLFASLDGSADLRVRPPTSPTLENFDAVLTDEITFTPMLNSLLLCGSATLLTVVCAALAAYPLSRHRSRLTRPYLLTILFTTCLPITAIMVPVYGLFVQVDLIDTMYGTALFLATAQLPFAIWLMKNFMDGVPKVLEEAAWTDGASTTQTLVRVVLPLMGPGVGVVTIYTFIMLWGTSSSPSCCCSPRATPGLRLDLHLFRQLRIGGLRAAGGVLDPVLDAGAAAVHPDLAPPGRRIRPGRRGQGMSVQRGPVRSYEP